MDELFAFALAFGDRAARPLDIRSRTSVAAIDEERSRPDVDGEIVLAGEVIIEAVQKQLFKARFAIVLRFKSGGCGGRVLVGRHELAFQTKPERL